MLGGHKRYRNKKVEQGKGWGTGWPGVNCNFKQGCQVHT